MTTREKALQHNLKVQQILKVYKQNSAAGQKFSFEYKRWVVAQIQLRDLLFSQF